MTLKPIKTIKGDFVAINPNQIKMVKIIERRHSKYFKIIFIDRTFIKADICYMVDNYKS